MSENTITLTYLRCARCDKRMSVFGIEHLTKFTCQNQKCRCVHVKIDGNWFDEKVLRIYRIQRKRHK